MQVKKQFASMEGEISRHNPQKNMEKHHLSILALGMLFQEAERELISVIGVCVMEQGQALLGR